MSYSQLISHETTGPLKFLKFGLINMSAMGNVMGQLVDCMFSK